MPEWLQPVATFMPLTYLGDALRQTMVGGAAFAPLQSTPSCWAAGWSSACVISARYFRWT